MTAQHDVRPHALAGLRNQQTDAIGLLILLGHATGPRFTTIGQDLTGGAAYLVDMLLRRTAGEETHSVVSPG